MKHSREPHGFINCARLCLKHLVNDCSIEPLGNSTLKSAHD